VSIEVALATTPNNRTVTFTVTGATPPIDWGWGDGTGETGPDLVQGHDYDRPGLYQASLSAKEGRRPILVAVPGVALSGPHIERLDPASVPLDAGIVPVTVTGRGFTDDHVVLVNGSAFGITTTFVDEETLTFPLAVGGAGGAWVQVIDPATMVVSNGAVFQVHTWPFNAGGAAVEEAAPASASYDPGVHTVDETLTYASGHPDEVQAIFDAESAGKGRVTLLDGLRDLGASG